jgi:hypothetical protein
MSYQFNPLSDEELDSINLIPDGVYNFEIVKSQRKVSQSGNNMAALTLKVWDDQGKIHNIFDYLIFSTVPLNIRKIKHFCDSIGQIEAYKKGEIPEEMGGYSGKVHIGIQERQPKKEGGFYDKKNIVIDYVMTDNGAVKHDSTDNIVDNFNDEIPF